MELLVTRYWVFCDLFARFLSSAGILIFKINQSRLVYTSHSQIDTQKDSFSVPQASPLFLESFPVSTSSYRKASASELNGQFICTLGGSRWMHREAVQVGGGAFLFIVLLRKEPVSLSIDSQRPTWQLLHPRALRPTFSEWFCFPTKTHPPGCSVWILFVSWLPDHCPPNTGERFKYKKEQQKKRIIPLINCRAQVGVAMEFRWGWPVSDTHVPPAEAALAPGSDCGVRPEEPSEPRASAQRLLYEPRRLFSYKRALWSQIFNSKSNA